MELSPEPLRFRPPPNQPNMTSKDLYDEALLMRLDTKIVSMTQQGQSESAIALMEQGIAMRVAIYGLESREAIEATEKLILLYNTVAMTKVTAGAYRAALELLNRAQDLVCEIGSQLDHLYVQTLNNMACCHRRMGKHQLALKALQHSLRKCTQGDGVAVTHLNMCAILSQLGQHDKALEHAQSAVLHCQEVLLSDSIRERLADQHSLLTEKIVVLGIAYHNLAVEEEHLRHYDTALEWYQKALRLAQEHIGANEPLTHTFEESYKAAAAIAASSSSSPSSQKKKKKNNNNNTRRKKTTSRFRDLQI